VDDLKEGRGLEYVDRSEVVLIFVSDGYFVSPNCMREFLRAIHDRAAIVTLTDYDASHGGLSHEKVREQLAIKHETCWGLAAELAAWPMVHPSVEQLFDVLYAVRRLARRPAVGHHQALRPSEQEIEWNRIGAFRTCHAESPLARHTCINTRGSSV
jgi:hypothetical protein